MATATDVAQMESEIAILRSTVSSQQGQIAVLTSERDQARVEMTLQTARAQEQLVKATRMHAIMSQVSMGLVAGLEILRNEERSDREVRRARQEHELGVGQDRPAFMSRGGGEPQAEPEVPISPRTQHSLNPALSPRTPRPREPDVHQPIERLRADQPSGQTDDHPHPLLPRAVIRSDDDDLRDHLATLPREQR